MAFGTSSEGIRKTPSSSASVVGTGMPDPETARSASSRCDIREFHQIPEGVLEELPVVSDV